MMRNPQSAASVQQTCNAINAACKANGGACAEYSCKSVSWDDVQRGTVGGALSCWGGNITDTRLWAKSGELLYTVHSDNWNEKLGNVDADSVAVVVGNHVPAGGGAAGEVELEAITLADFLKNTGKYASYTGVDRDTSLYSEQLDQDISIRFQTTFLPIDEEEDKKLGTLEFCTEAYNYNTISDDDPRNAVLLCTTQGIAFQEDGAGAKKLYHHAVEQDGQVHRYWLEAEQSEHKVGGPQKETKQEAMLAAARGKATSSVIGIEAMGTRFNVLMTVQIPLQQKPKPKSQVSYANYAGLDEECCFDCFAEDDYCDECAEKGTYNDYGAFSNKYESYVPFSGYRGASQERAAGPKVGRSNAARVSRGSEVNAGEVWTGVNNTEPKRDTQQHITVTVVLYNTVAGGVPSVEDLQAAIADMEQLYAACAWKGKLAEKGASFMKSELTVSEAADIVQKVTKQPYVAPNCSLVKNATVFPRKSS